MYIVYILNCVYNVLLLGVIVFMLFVFFLGMEEIEVLENICF